MKNKKVWVIAIAVIMVMGLIGAVIEKTSPATTPSVAKQEQSQAQPTTTAQKYQYKVLSRVENKTVENVDVLVQPGEVSAEAIAMEVKASCKKPCNINVYDDQKAYDLESQYNKMMGDTSTQPNDLQTWKKTNYVYVADHLVGAVEFETGTFDQYPYKDWYYKELKGEK